MVNQVDFAKEDVRITQLIGSGNNTEAIMAASSCIEALLLELYQETILSAQRAQADQLRADYDALIQGKESLSFGQWARLFKQSLESHLRQKYSPRWLTVDALYALVNLRNDCVHKPNYKPSTAEAEHAHSSLLLFLQDTGRGIQPSGFTSGGASWSSILDRKILKDPPKAVDHP